MAERLIVLGFFDEVLDQLPGARPRARAARARSSAKLDRRDGLMPTAVTVGRRSTTSRPARPARFEVDGRAVALVRIGDDVYAIGDRCSHARRLAAEGEVIADEREIECWKHGSTFSLVTGEPQLAAGHPARAGLRRRASTTATSIVVDA